MPLVAFKHNPYGKAALHLEDSKMDGFHWTKTPALPQGWKEF